MSTEPATAESVIERISPSVQRINNLKKLFNIRAGWTPEEDVLPERFLREELSDDAQASISSQHLQDAVEAYNLGRGWSAEGWLDAQQVEQLGLPPH